MKVMIDTNIFISTVLFPNSVPAKAVHAACEKHELILCDHIINECYNTMKIKFPQHIPELDELLATIDYETVTAPRVPAEMIADPKDAPILNAAILHGVDVIISGDKHFLDLEMEYPRPMKAADFLEMYGE